jgi:hypothetical protein
MCFRSQSRGRLPGHDDRDAFDKETVSLQNFKQAVDGGTIGYLL